MYVVQLLKDCRQDEQGETYHFVNVKENVFSDFVKNIS